MTSFSGITVTTQEVMAFLRRDLQIQEIYRTLLAQKIITLTAEEVGIVVEPEEVQAELDQIRYEHHFDHPAQLLAWLTQQMTTLGEFEQRIREKLTAQKLAYHLFSDQVSELLQQQATDFDQLSLYEIRVPYENLAREIFYQIEEEEVSFFEAAHVYDIDESRRLVCGFAGRQLRSQLKPEIATHLRDARTDEVIGPVQIADHRFALFLIDEITAPQLIPEITETLIDSMFQDWLEEKLSTYLD